MKTFRFKDFAIYQQAHVYRKKVCQHLKAFPAEERFRLVDQIHRSCLSVILNIAEGSAKATDPDFRRYLNISIASLNETVAGFDCAREDGLITDIEYQSIAKEAESLAKQIGGFIKALSQKPTAKKPQALRRNQ
ncbi:four helix bundle protein [Patescibacteria group bacterium]|nr:four helix bundle protein [Patescibacteria group bacterium]